MKNILIYTTCFIVFLAACTKPIDITIPQQKPKLCIASQVIPDQVMVVGVTNSFTSLYEFNQDSTGNNNFNFEILVKHARVSISYENKTEELFKVSDGIYAGINTLFTPQSTYTLNVYDSTTGESVSAVTTMMAPVTVNSMSATKLITSMDTSYAIDFEIQDNPATEDFYMVVPINSKSISGGGGLLNAGGLLQNLGKTPNVKLYSDDVAKNNKISQTWYSDIDFQGAMNDTIIMQVARIDKGYFSFLKAFNRSGSIVNQLTGEPINFPSNVQNGYGYFNAFYPNVKTLILNP